MSSPFDSPFRAVVNHLLHNALWARERLRPYAGTSAVEFCVGDMLKLRFGLDDEGYLASPPDEPSRQVALSLPLSTVVRNVLDRSELARDGMSIQGDAEFAEVIGFVFQNLSWDIEEDLSRIFGDQGGQRIANTVQAIGNAHRSMFNRFQTGVAEFLTEEKPLLVHRARATTQQSAARTLRDDAARLEKRIQRLESQLRELERSRKA